MQTADTEEWALQGAWGMTSERGAGQLRELGWVESLGSLLWSWQRAGGGCKEARQKGDSVTPEITKGLSLLFKGQAVLQGNWPKQRK